MEGAQEVIEVFADHGSSCGGPDEVGKERKEVLNRH